MINYRCCGENQTVPKKNPKRKTPKTEKKRKKTQRNIARAIHHHKGRDQTRAFFFNKEARSILIRFSAD